MQINIKCSSENINKILKNYFDHFGDKYRLREIILRILGCLKIFL